MQTCLLFGAAGCGGACNRNEDAKPPAIAAEFSLPLAFLPTVHLVYGGLARPWTLEAG